MAARKSYRAAQVPADDSGEMSEARRVTVAGVIAIAVDTVLNAGGMWSVVLNMDKTESYKMFAGGLGSSPPHPPLTEMPGADMQMLPALGIALALGLGLALIPHKLWHYTGANDAQRARRRIAAVVAGLGGWYTTWMCIQVLFGFNVVSFILSLVVEWGLFEFKREILR